MVTREAALPGRPEPIVLSEPHRVFGTELNSPVVPGCERTYVALGCFWGAERLFWRLEGVRHTAVGYMGGFTPNATYEEVCTGLTGHAEAVLVDFDPSIISYAQLVQLFFEEHDPTQGMRQGADVGSQYRSALFVTSEAQREIAQKVLTSYQDRLRQSGFGEITTTVETAGPLYFAEQYHQQYLDRNPNGYCGLAGTGVSCPVGLEGVK